jgi:hypothetical protein
MPDLDSSARGLSMPAQTWITTTTLIAGLALAFTARPLG